VSYRRLLVLALIAGLPGFAQAQFTTFIPPKNKVADSVKAVVVAQQKAQVDSSVQAQITNMKTWVDSAAGIASTTPMSPMTAADSAAAATAATAATAQATPPTPTTPNAATAPSSTTPRRRSTRAAQDSSTFPTGARAPSTASSLPLMMVLGALSLLAGVVLMRRAPTEARARSGRRTGA
jgi:hypothetical protein